MAEWEFPDNAFTRAIRVTAELRGQHRDRIEIRDPDWKLPPGKIVRPLAPCAVTYGVFVHEANDGRSFCKHCGALVQG